MKKLLLILICLFVSFEVKSKEIVLECDGVSEVFYDYLINKPREKEKTNKKRIYYLNERKKYLGTEDKKIRKKSGVNKTLNKYMKKHFKKTDQKFSINFIYSLDPREDLTEKYDTIKEKRWTFIYYIENKILDRYSLEISDYYREYGRGCDLFKGCTEDDDFYIKYSGSFKGKCKKVEKKL